MYYVFAYDEYYPSGGAHDLVFFNDDLSCCIKHAVRITSKKHYAKNGHTYENAHVVGTDDVNGLTVEWSN